MEAIRTVKDQNERQVTNSSQVKFMTLAVFFDQKDQNFKKKDFLHKSVKDAIRT